MPDNEIDDDNLNIILISFSVIEFGAWVLKWLQTLKNSKMKGTFFKKFAKYYPQNLMGFWEELVLCSLLSFRNNLQNINLKKIQRRNCFGRIKNGTVLIYMHKILSFPSPWILFHISFQREIKPRTQYKILTKGNPYEIDYSRKMNLCLNFQSGAKSKVTKIRYANVNLFNIF